MADIHNTLWDDVDEVSNQINAELGSFGLDSVVAFTKSYRNIPKGTRALVLDRHGEYYALTVNGKYVEGIHQSFLGE